MVSTDMGTSAASVFSIMVWDSPEKEEGSLGHRRPKQEVDERAAKAPAAPNPFKPPGPATHPRERADEAGTAAATSLGSQLDPGKHKRGQEASGRLHPSLRKGSEVVSANCREEDSKCCPRKLPEETINER